MPTPIGHALAGLAIAGLGVEKNDRKSPLFAAGIFFALLPDLDLVPGLVIGAPNLFHHGFTHGLFFVIVVPVFFFLMLSRGKADDFTRVTTIAVMAGISHIVLDFFGRDSSPPFGVPFFWPFSPEYFIASRPFFLDIQRSGSGLVFFASLFSPHNIQAAAREILIVGPFVFATWLFKRFTRSKPCD